jgi:hypothetical protein
MARMAGFRWAHATTAIFVAMLVAVVFPAHAADDVQGFCTASKNPQPFFGKSIKFRALQIRLRDGALINDADNLIVTSNACRDQGFIADAQTLLAKTAKQRRFELVGKLIGGEAALYEIVGTIQAPASPRQMAKLVAISVR